MGEKGKTNKRGPLKNIPWPIRHLLSVWPSNSFGPRTIIMQIIPTAPHLFTSSHPVLLQQRGTAHPSHGKGSQTRDTKTSIRHQMKRLKCWASESPPSATRPWRRDFPTCLMENTTHMSHLSLRAHVSTACGLSACWTHPLESLSLVPRESGPQ